MRVLVAGGGKVGGALAAALARAGWAPLRWTRSGAGAVLGEVMAVDVAVVAVTDAAIGAVAARLCDEGWADGRTVLLHTAGAVSPRAAFASVRERVRGVGLLHPLRAFAARVVDTAGVSLEGTVFGISGDAAAVRAAWSLAEAVGGRPVELHDEALARWHAAAVLASNHTLALIDTAVDLLVAEGLDRREATRALAALLHSAADNLAAVGLPAALTGPIARGDVDTVARHLAALPPALVPLYRTTGLATVELARRQGQAEPAMLDRIAALLRGEPLGPASSRRR